MWLDKLCIDQQNIADDLQCLPVFLMACKKLLILAGPKIIIIEYDLIPRIIRYYNSS